MSDKQTSDIARDKAARLLKKRGSASSLNTSEAVPPPQQSKPPPPRESRQRHGSISTVSFMDEPSHTDELHPPVKLENTYQMSPTKRFPVSTVRHILKDVLQNYLQEERYEPELCRQMTKTISEVIKARVKDLMVPRYKIICLIHIGQLNNQGLRIGSRCLWDPNNDTFATQDFQNGSLYAVATVYGVYYE
ncbi:PREDICTED: tctex1 domain-containing protein 1-B-like isoform X1 [Branchiostoma belcheri]|uniref:Tctex1 domain-containing protein 1-B-like isoform X1 n=1 Tax=Branchiostoma belcheri TaxID=7741 RepID=A0A6P5AGI1_BRABE|nr:PREDICTED: tctex1 domain-containing protein 1-B-like isoform X1 [Branchiostoma belcheri]XP_019645441.1 PREDICTED: tctex1 domain-containing protein 1-B-like isoform X1 [Branchiostoma belcheri]KAI8509152.1 Tctex1 domain-containing protein 1 [Branchiostoma belcheri]